MRKRSAIAFLILLACETPKKKSLEVIDFDNVQEMPADLMIEKAILLDSGYLGTAWRRCKNPVRRIWFFHYE